MSHRVVLPVLFAIACCSSFVSQTVTGTIVGAIADLFEMTLTGARGRD